MNRDTDARLVLTISWIAAVVAVTVAIILPVGFFVISYQYQAGALHAEAGITALMLSQVINASPETWHVPANRAGRPRPEGRPGEPRRADRRHAGVGARGHGTPAPTRGRAGDPGRARARAGAPPVTGPAAGLGGAGLRTATPGSHPWKSVQDLADLRGQGL